MKKTKAKNSLHNKNNSKMTNFMLDFIWNWIF